MDRFERMQKRIHHEHASKRRQHGGITLESDENQNKNSRQEQKSYDASFYQLLDIPALGDVVVLRAEDKIRITGQENIREVGHLRVERGDGKRVLIDIRDDTARRSRLCQTMPERLLEESQIPYVHALEMRGSRSLARDDLREFRSELEESDHSHQEDHTRGGDDLFPGDPSP